MKCPSNQELTNYILSSKEDKEIESHLVHCNKCMDTVILSQEAPLANNRNYKAVFALIVASLLLSLLPYNITIIGKNDFSGEIISFETYVELESKETDFIWELAIYSVQERVDREYIDLFSDDDLDVFEI